MAKKSRAGNSYKVQYKSYKAENRFVKNKRAKLEKHCLENPNDEKAMQTLEKGTWNYTRNRRSGGHECRPNILHVVKNPMPKLPLTAGEQLIQLGLVDEKRYQKSIRYRKSRVLRRKPDNAGQGVRQSSR